ncbi:hypothetical protein LZ554_000234 [Drepanopeziza brunnea f. sp. 'monogermtubi']|nr:hypothetical protein LZ554_000234 [Drepanopeziza brunnea f. sp. 'monogermtubi']
MNQHYDQTHDMGIQDFFTWRQKSATTTPDVADEDVPAEVDEPPDNHLRLPQSNTDFQKSLVRPQSTRKESLLTKAFHAPAEIETPKPTVSITKDLTRRRSMMSNASIASTADLTSDGGLTSPARTNTPSPPFPNTTHTNFAPYLLKPSPMAACTIGHTPLSEVISISPRAQPDVEVPRKRCISFMCDGNKEAAGNAKKVAALKEVEEKPVTSTLAVVEEPKPRRSTIKFACSGPQPKAAAEEPTTASQNKHSENSRRPSSRSPSLPRKSPRQALPARAAHRDSTGTVRRASRSPVAIRIKPRYIVADETTINKSAATRFHEFASEEPQEDDWISKDAEIIRAKLTIGDTLKKENAIRQLGTEAEEEALEEEEEEDLEDIDEGDGSGSDDENEDDEDDDDDDDGDEDDDQETTYDSDEDASDGNESDNEAGFADSDESDAEGEFSFWTPGKKATGRDSLERAVYRPSAHRTASTSSIDSLNHMEPARGASKPRRRPIKIRPGTPDLPDSTDFVCGTLDEDRPLEDAYVSCIEARRNAKHKLTPQDIDPSFPTSDPEDEEDDDDVVNAAHDSEEPVWLHGRFEESDDEQYGRHRSTTLRRRSPGLSPRRLHSPPPARRLHSPPLQKQRLHSPPPPKHRLRSPPPRKLFGHSPQRMSPPMAQNVRSPDTSPMSAKGIKFAPLGSRPGLTHTKSLPRTPNAFCRQYRASRLIAANGNEGNDNASGHVRGAIDIVKGLEEKRRRRKDKLQQKQCNRKNKSERRPPLPGRGAERMREVGLLMAARSGKQDPYMLSA